MQILTIILLLLFVTESLQAQKPSAPVLLSLGEKTLDALRAKSKGRVLVMNLWATWCKPCIEEFPDFVKLQKTYADKGLDVIFISIDDDDAKTKHKVMAFLRKMNVSSTSYIKESGDDEKFINAVNRKWTGAVPSTLIYGKNGELVKMKVEESSLAELERIIKPLLEK